MVAWKLRVDKIFGTHGHLQPLLLRCSARQQIRNFFDICQRRITVANGFSINALRRTAAAFRTGRRNCGRRRSMRETPNAPSAQSETGKAIAVGRIRITDAGRRWLEDAAKSELRGPNRFKDFWRE